MSVLHGTWCKSHNDREGFFFLWAERSEIQEYEITSSRIGIKKRKTHPFQPTTFELFNTFKGVVEQSFISLNSDFFYHPPIALMPVLIPTFESGYPDLSFKPEGYLSELMQGDVHPREWKVKGHVLSSNQTAVLLLAVNRLIPEKTRSIGTHYRVTTIGEDLLYWSTIFLHALGIVIGQRYLPGIKRGVYNNQQILRSHWFPVLSNMDIEFSKSMAERMPSICSGTGYNTHYTSDIIIDEFVDSSVNILPRVITKMSKYGKTSTINYAIAPSEVWYNSLFDSAESFISIQGRTSEFAQMETSVNNWMEEVIYRGPPLPFSLLFRLETPDSEILDDDNGKKLPWKLSYLIQSNDDPSLLIDLGMVFSESDQLPEAIRENRQALIKSMLFNLRKAGGISKSVSKGLVTETPAYYSALSTDEVYQFLELEARNLVDAGFQVMIPKWWEERKVSPTFKMSIASDSTGHFSREQLMKFDWKAAVRGNNGKKITISDAEFQKIVSMKHPLVRLGGKWVEIDVKGRDNALKLLRKYTENGGVPFMDVVRMAVNRKELSREMALDLSYDGSHLKKTIDSLLGHRSFDLQETPEEFNGILRPYQQRGFSWLYFMRSVGLGAILADDMGLGKTIQVIALLLRLKKDKGPHQPSLIICPMSIMENWKKEFSRFAPSLKVMIHHGPDRHNAHDRFQDTITGFDVIITSNSLAFRDVELLSKTEWGNVVIDEAQNFKNHWTKQAQAIRKLRTGCRIALTGTPVENRLAELWSLLDFLNNGYLGGITEFRRDFENPIRKGNKIAMTSLQNIVMPFILRREKTDKNIIRDLPEKNEMKVFCGLTEEQASLYEAHIQDMMSKIENTEGITRKGLILSTLLRLKQICDHPSLYLGDNSRLAGRSEKLDRISDMIAELLIKDEKILVFTQFVKMGERIVRYLSKETGKEILFFHGQLSKKNRDEILDKFGDPANKSSPIMVASLKAGGLGLNLTSANNVFHFDRWWNPAVENQATDRVYRIGQSKNVQVYKFITVGTLEENIDSLMEEKSRLARGVLKPGEDWLTELSTDELREIISLKR